MPKGEAGLLLHSAALRSGAFLLAFLKSFFFLLNFAHVNRFATKNAAVLFFGVGGRRERQLGSTKQNWK